MLRIRMSRVGRKNAPTYRFVVSDRTKDTFGDSLETLGSYNPRTKELVLNKERVTYWISVGAQPSDTVHNILVTNGMVQEKKRSVSSLTKKRRAQIAEKQVEGEKSK